MIPTPQHMVEASLLSSLVLIFFILLYKTFKPRKKINLLLLLIIVSIVPTVSIFREGVYQSGDFNLHIFRAMDFYAALQDGVLFPSWAERLNNNFGYPLFVFLNPLPYYVISLFHFLGFSFIASMKLFLALTYIISGVFMYLFVKRLSNSTKAAFIAGIFYLFAPYHFVDQHFRVALGEITAFTFLPLFFLSLLLLIRTKKLIHMFYVSLAFTLLFFSHQAILIFSLAAAVPFSIFYFLKEKKQIRTLALLAGAGFLSIALTAYVWLPQLTHTAYTHAYLFHRMVVDFPNVHQLLYSPWRYGLLFQGPQGELSFAMGYIHICVVLLAIFHLITKRMNTVDSKQISLFVGIFFLLLFLMLPLSSFIWKAVPILNTVQFSYRILLPITFIMSIVAGLTLARVKTSFFVVIIILVTIFSSILNWGQRTMISTIDDTTLSLLLPHSTFAGEGLVQASSKWWPHETQLWMPESPKKPLEILSGTGVVKSTFRNSVRHEYILNATTPVLLKENTSYFPNWQIYVDGKPSVITYNDSKYPAVMLFSVEKGLHSIRVQYSDTPQHSFAKKIFIITFLISLLVMIIRWAILLKPRLFRFTKK